MPIPVSHEGEDMGGPPYEHCYFCDTPTPFWFTVKDVACCKDCAASHKPGDIKSKSEWFRLEVLRHGSERD